MEQKKPAYVDTNALVESVKNDMLNVERGKQWIMSSYSPFKDKAAFPGFVDDSFEEIRLGYYEAQKTGRVDYFQQIQAKHREATLRVKRLQAPSPDFVSIFVQLYNTPAPAAVNTATSGHFGNTGNPNNIFAGNQHQTWGTPRAGGSNNIFAANTNQSNPFASPSGTNTFHAKPIFGASPATNNVFSKSAAQTGSGAIFAQSGSSNAPVFGSSGSAAFGSQNLSGTLFGGGAIFGSQSGGTNSIFGGGAATAAPAVFGSPVTQSSSIFGSTAATLFGTASTTQPSVFGGSNAFGNQPVFGSQSTFGTSPLSNTAPSAVFGGPTTFGAPSTDIFGKTVSFLHPQPFANHAVVTSPPTSLFGGTVGTTQPAIFASATQPLFGSAVATSQPSIFASNSVAISQPSIFGSTTATPPMSMFGGVANTSQTTPIFASALSNTQISAFNASPFASAQQANTSLFGQQQTFAQSVATQPAGAFGVADADKNTDTVNSAPFVTVGSSAPLVTVGSSAPLVTVGSSAPLVTVGASAPFAAAVGTGDYAGSSPFTTVSPFMNPLGVGPLTVRAKLTSRDYARTNPEYYSAELSDADLAAFQNMKFEFGLIPVDPPTVDLCV